jgi:cell division topological specificity factor
MRLLDFFTRQVSAPVAKERLQLLLSHERGGAGRSELLELLRSEILQVIAKRLDVNNEQVKVSVQRDDGISTLALAIELPTEGAFAVARRVA